MMQSPPDRRLLEIVKSIKDKVSVDRLKSCDVQPILNYWYRSSPGYLESLGADPKKFPTEETMKASLEERVANIEKNIHFKCPTIVVCFDEIRIGFHSVTHIHDPVKGTGIFHANFWNPLYRGRSIGMITYLSAAKIFMDQFSLEKLLYQSPKINKSCNRVKEKLGISKVGEGIVTHPLAADRVESWNYELTRKELDRLILAWL